ncbi:tRNA pseudouridine(38-40) synthase TruA [Canibacter zhoujuaniae]|uniref:tRNA pseudouridine(38-40) synthase TruA n=1 Tax=Canibacter zhoujuaniae TaxID=2708343 RepID=UPI0014223193|nr:tRNA pseudouridine(38-40) synthase TruA [Canibacter zhoujuaniae]
MPRLRLDIAYDGTDFHGWATQPGLRTVQGALEQALTTVLRRKPAGAETTVTAADPEWVRLTVGGRTDAGVHARGQVAHLDVSEAEATQLLDRPRRINGVLVRQGVSDAVVRAVTQVPDEFDARFGALYRRYEYRICNPGALDLLTRNHTVELKKTVDFDAMQAASQSLVGLRDFATFCKAREGATSVRHLSHFEWRQVAPGTFAARVQADAFCHSMVRALVGAAVAVGTGRISLRELAELEAARTRSAKFVVMPAHGLSLEEIAYPAPGELAARALQTRARRQSLS